MFKKHVCNVYIFQISFHFAYHRWWLGSSSSALLSTRKSDPPSSSFSSSSRAPLQAKNNYSASISALEFLFSSQGTTISHILKVLLHFALLRVGSLDTHATMPLLLLLLLLLLPLISRFGTNSKKTKAKKKKPRQPINLPYPPHGLNDENMFFLLSLLSLDQVSY